MRQGEIPPDAAERRTMIPISDDNPTHSFPILTVILIAACVTVFAWQLSLGEAAGQQAVYAFGFIPATVFLDADLPPDIAVIPPELTVFSSMFLHGSIMHIAGNMLYLWIFGNNVEDALGKSRFIVFYLVTGVAAAFAQGVAAPASEIPMIGASGAISGVLGAYLLLFPHARVLCLIPLGIVLYPVRIAAVFVLGLYLVLQIGSALLANPDEPGVAFLAHIGGFVAGMALVPFFKRRDVALFAPARSVAELPAWAQRPRGPWDRDPPRGPWG